MCPQISFECDTAVVLVFNFAIFSAFNLGSKLRENKNKLILTSDDYTIQSFDHS